MGALRHGGRSHEPAWVVAHHVDGETVAGVGRHRGGEGFVDPGHLGRVDVLHHGREVANKVLPLVLDVELAHEFGDGARRDAEVEQGAHGVHVGGGLGRHAIELLGGGVLRRADEGAHAGEPITHAAEDLGDAEVGHADLRHRRARHLRFEEHVFRLQIAVDHALPVGDGERIAHLHRDAGCGARRQDAHAPDVVEQRAAGLEAGHQVGRVAGALHKAAALHDLRVVQPLKDLGFGGEAAQVGALIALLVEHLQRQERAHLLLALPHLAAEVGHARAADRQPPVHPVGAVDQRAIIEQLAPPDARARAPAPEVGAPLGITPEGGEATATIAGAGPGFRHSRQPNAPLCRAVA